MCIDSKSCKYESCRNGIVPFVSSLEQDKVNYLPLESNNKLTRYISLLVITLGILILLVLWMFRGVEKFNRSGGIGVG